MDDRTRRIRELNLAFWNDPIRRGRIMMTTGVAAMDNLFKMKLFWEITTFKDWNLDNDPHQEADFINVEIEGVRVWAKLDYYDRNMEYGSEDPADPTKTFRVATIMLPEEF